MAEVLPQNILNPKPLSKIPYERGDPTFGETFIDNTEQLIRPAAEGAAKLLMPSVFDNSSERDSEFDFNSFLVGKNIDIKSSDGQYLSNYSANAVQAEEHYLKLVGRKETQRAIEQAGFLQQMLADPILFAEVFTPLIYMKGFRAVASGGKFFANKALQSQVDNALLKFQGLSKPKQIAAIASAEALVFEGTRNVIEGFNAIQAEGKDTVDAIIKESLDTTMAVSLAGIFGLSLGKGFSVYSDAKQKTTLENYQRTLAAARTFQKDIDAVPTSGDSSFIGPVMPTETKPFVEGQLGSKSKAETVTLADEVTDLSDTDLDFMGSWFTESIFYKALPTSVKTVILSDAPKNIKLKFLKLINDGGVGFKLNQTNKSIGRSVFQESGELAGKWVDVYRGVHDIWSEVNPSGGATILDVPIQNALEKIKKIRGKENLTFEDFGEHIVNLYLTKASDVTPLESRALEQIRKYFDEWDQRLNDVGLLGYNDVLVSRKSNIEGRLGSMESVTQSIIKSNNNYLTTRLSKAEADLSKKQDLLGKLEGTFKTRGLTEKQAAFKARLEEEIPLAKARVDDFKNALNVSNVTKTAGDAVKVLDDLKLTVKAKGAIENLDAHTVLMRERLDNVNSYLDGTAVEKGLREPFFPRYFNRRAIEADREGLENIITQHYMENPTTWSWDDRAERFVEKTLDASEPMARGRAKRTVASIMDEIDDDGLEGAYFGAGRSKHMIHRTLDIPNEKIKNYIVTDLKQVMIAYHSKIAPKYAFARQFRTDSGKPATLDDLIATNTKEMKAAGTSEKNIDMINKEFVASYDRIVGRVLTNPDSIQARTADWLRTATQWTYLGGAGVAAVGDFANVFMDHEMRIIAKGLISLADGNSLKMARKELNKSGDGIEIIAGAAHMRQMENISQDPFANGMTDKINHGFYIANLLAPITLATKHMDALFRGHTIIEASVRLAGGNASKWEQEFLARYNITPNLAARIAKAPVETTKNNLYLPNTDAWIDEGALVAFRSALKAGVMNRIIMGTPADKPLMMSGKSYVPMSVAEQVGMKESNRVKGYSEIESPLLSLPFTFYTYTMGAFNKITTNYAQGMVRNNFAHLAMGMFFGYQIVKFRTPSWAWDEMDAEDKALRAFDFSGLAALYSDMFYRSLDMGMSFDLVNPTPFEPKFKSEPDAVGGVVSIFGAPADYTYNHVKMMQEFARGNYSTGSEMAVRNTPLIWNMFTKNMASDLKNFVGDSFDDAK